MEHPKIKTNEFIGRLTAKIKPISRYSNIPNEEPNQYVDISTIVDCGIVVALKDKDGISYVVFEADLDNTFIEMIG